MGKKGKSQMSQIVKIPVSIVPSKFLNVYDFGMKMYTSQPITAQLFFQEDL